MTTKQVRSGRDPIVAAAVSHFTERGYHGTSMRDIAAGAGVTVASIYHHFDGKQAVLQFIMAGTMRDLLEATTSVDDEGTTPTARLRAFVDAWVLFHTTRQPEALIGASEIRSLDDDGRDLVVGLRDEQERRLRGIVEAGVASGEFTTPYPVEATRALVTMGAAIASWYRAGGPLTPAELSDRYCELAFGLVRGPSVLE
ncbi:TetR family transcriptional regulator [Nocardioides caeni]|uniref:TetR/AcrR family transcriptional regulator n=1 Tax=Nocardioides caeni TaxID=574700 RepID=A0A4S8N7E3_9ACTN|nr:TetR family transcriptional regulator [Nocardioides caeni]THV12150.1 TetR/AcrR family transcriptional regulator [Nocardioides caeni]